MSLRRGSLPANCPECLHVGASGSGRLHMSTAECVARVMAVYPKCGFAERDIADEVMMAASAAGIAVEMNWAANH